VEALLKETRLLNYSDSLVQSLIRQRGWQELGKKDRILAIYNYVRDEMAFGYNKGDDITAVNVLQDGYGQCNTKGILFMALLRAVCIPCRIHGFYVDKIIQKGAFNGLFYQQSPKEILHSWVEVFYNEKWLNIEGFILDLKYISGLQEKFSDCTGSFCGYAVATDDFQNPPIDWNENDTYIQKDGIIQDLGIYDSPDELFSAHSQQIGWFKSFMFKYVARHSMNKNIAKIRLP